MRSFKSINEEGNLVIQRLNKYGATYTITFQFRGQTKFIQMFFPQSLFKMFKTFEKRMFNMNWTKYIQAVKYYTLMLVIKIPRNRY